MALRECIVTALAGRSKNVDLRRPVDKHDDDDDDGGDDDDKKPFVRRGLANARLCNNGTINVSISAPPPMDTPSIKSTSTHNTNAQLADEMARGEVWSVRKWQQGACYVVASEKRVFKLFVAYEEAFHRVCEKERRMHELATRFARDAVMPLVDVFVAEVPWQWRTWGEQATVLAMRRANGDTPDWKSMDGAELAVRGEQLLEALEMLAACGIVHLDIKPDNLVLHNDRVRLIDFGSAATVGLFDDCTLAIRACGTRGFMAPEMIDKERARFTPAADVFSAGVVLALAEVPVAECVKLRKLLKRMQAECAEDRPTASEALAAWRDRVMPALCPKVPVEEVADFIDATAVAAVNDNKNNGSVSGPLRARDANTGSRGAFAGATKQSVSETRGVAAGGEVGDKENGAA